MSDPAVTTVVVEPCDRLARLAVAHGRPRWRCGRRIVVLGTTNTTGITGDLVADVADVTGVLAFVCARLCGRRSTVKRAVGVTSG